MKKPAIATLCTHSALQIFHGARSEGFETIGICKKGAERTYDAFPLAKPDKYLYVSEYSDILETRFQKKLEDGNAVIIPHGSFVEYVGAHALEREFHVPMFGNKRVLSWESDRKKGVAWLGDAGLKLPAELAPSDIDRPCIVKFHGAKGGRGFFLCSTPDEFRRGIGGRKDYIIQEYVIGVRYYPHFFYSPMLQRLELLGMDRRDECNIDALARIGASRGDVERTGTYVVTGNVPVAARESLLPQMLSAGERVVSSSQRLFPPGMIGPFCLEMICKDNLELVTFEISARIVAGTNLYPQGSPYSAYLFSEPMSTGRRIAREMRIALEQKRLDEVVC